MSGIAPNVIRTSVWSASPSVPSPVHLNQENWSRSPSPGSVLGSSVCSPATTPKHSIPTAMAKQSAHMSDEPKKTHLLVMQHGLWGTYADWDKVVDALGSTGEASASHVLIHPTRVNLRGKTIQGVDVCGQRLAEEIQSIASETPTLETITLVGLSIGGLICRYAAAALLDPETGLMAGMKPGHYVSVASPHLGVSDSPGYLNSAGFYEWKHMSHGMDFPTHISYHAHKLLLDVSLGRITRGEISGGSVSDEDWVHNLAQDEDHDRMRKNKSKPKRRAGYPSGTEDDDGPEQGSSAAHSPSAPQKPLFLRMVEDNTTGSGLWFMSALKAFQSRTVFANHTGDQWISWCNGSLRHHGELPEIDHSCGRPCVVSPSTHDLLGLESLGDGPPLPEQPGTPRIRKETSTARLAARQGQDCGKLRIDPYRESMIHEMLVKLKGLGWTRVDVSFHNASSQAARSSHDLIIQGQPVKGSKFVKEGEESVSRLASYLLDLVAPGAAQKDTQTPAPLSGSLSPD